MAVRLREATAPMPIGLLGRTGVRMPRLVLGTGPWARGVDSERAGEILDLLREAGGSAVEVSDGDGGVAESLIGSHLGATVAREDLVLIGRSGRGPSSQEVKRGCGDTSRRSLMASLDATLERLGCEHLDLWLIDGHDGVTPMDDVAATMAWALESGRATDVGVARVPAWRAVDLAHRLRERRLRLVAHAATYSLLERDAELDVIPAAADLGYGVMAAMPLAGGALTGKYRHGTPADSRLATGRGDLPEGLLMSSSRAIVESVATAADGLGVHPTAVALAWALRQDGIDTLTVGCRTAVQLRGCLRALDLNLPQEILDVFDEVSLG